MTPHYTRKLQQALLDIGHQVEKDTTTPTIEELTRLFDEFVKRQDKKSVDKLLAGVVKWEVGEL